jgi:uncharacterized protein YndB with AHSA1/START domain
MCNHEVALFEYREQNMIERHTTMPVSTEELWEALTDPDLVEDWFGGTVVWTLEPGGELHVNEDDGTQREGSVDEVNPGRLLRFTWWPTGDEDRRSEVTYVIEPDEAGSLLTITERPAFDIIGSTAGSTPWSASTTWSAWTRWDDRGLALRLLVDVRSNTTSFVEPGVTC